MELSAGETFCEKPTHTTQTPLYLCTHTFGTATRECNYVIQIGNESFIQLSPPVGTQLKKKRGENILHSAGQA